METQERPIRRIPAALVLGLACAAAAAADEVAPPRGAVATVGGVAISAEELKAAEGNQLLALRTQEFNAEERVLEDMIADRLLDKEAAAQKVTVEALLKAEVDAKAEAVADGDVRAMYEQVKGQLQGMPEAQGLEKVRAFLVEQHVGARRARFLRELRTREGVRIFLEPPRVPVTEGDAPAKGPKGAPVTIIEFSDFQCPYCARAAPVLKRVEERYGDRVRIVYRDFPLVDIHKEASKASEAGACAREQGKFWEMHDQIFSKPQGMTAADLKQRAKDIGIDEKAFAACLDSGRHQATWQAHAEDGRRAGVSGTPAFFVNGRMMGGVQPFETFASVIEDELDRNGVSVPSAPEKAAPSAKTAPEKPAPSPKPAPGSPRD